MKILMVVPTLNYTYSYPHFMSANNFPMGFAYLAGSLKAAGFEVVGLNANNRPGFSSVLEMLKVSLTESIKESSPALICTGGLCTDFAFLRDTIKICRELTPDTPIVLGGNIVTNDAEFIFTTLKPDYAILGEGEEILVQLARTLDAGKFDQDLKNIANLYYWDGDKAIYTYKNYEYGDINQRPFPEYDAFGIQDMIQKYSRSSGYLTCYSQAEPKLMTLIAARSCPFSCTFCIHRTGIRYRARSISNIMEEIAVLYRKYEFNTLYILDELFAINKLRLREFSVTLMAEKKRQGWNFNWGFQTHASASFDKETLLIAKEAGCYFFVYGMESASPTVLASMEKRTHPAQFIEAINLASEVGIGFGGAFIFGDVAENPDTIFETTSFFMNHCKHIHATFGHISPYPGSKLFDICIEKGLIKNKLAYYEDIVRAASNINMTKIPDRIWSFWLLFYKYFALTMPWLKSTNLLSKKRLEHFEDNPMAKYSNASLFEIEARCPHCGHVNHCQHMVMHSEKNQFNFLVRLKEKLVRSRIIPWLFKVSVALLSLVGPYRKMFINFRSDYNQFFEAAITGCTNCNKRFRVKLK